jgi:hypothetical protein
VNFYRITYWSNSWQRDYSDLTEIIPAHSAADALVQFRTAHDATNEKTSVRKIESIENPDDAPRQQGLTAGQVEQAVRRGMDPRNPG